MFIYELIALRMPFEDEENGGVEVINLRGHVLSGGRPSITSKVCLECVTCPVQHVPTLQIRLRGAFVPYTYLKQLFAIFL